MRGAKLEDHLIFRAKFEHLLMTSRMQIPDVQCVAVFAGEKEFPVHPIFDHVGSVPFAGEHGVVPEMPPEVIREILRAAFDFPWSLDLEGFGIEDEGASGTIAIDGAECIDIDAIGTAVNGMLRTAVNGFSS